MQPPVGLERDRSHSSVQPVHLNVRGIYPRCLAPLLLFFNSSPAMSGSRPLRAVHNNNFGLRCMCCNSAAVADVKKTPPRTLSVVP